MDLGEAIRRNWLELWYRPKLDLRSGQAIGAHPPSRIWRPPAGEFSVRSERSRPPSSCKSALHIALRDARDFAAARPGLGLAINVPVGALVELPIPSIVRDYRPRYGEWDGIGLEITEDQAIRDIEMTQEIATRLRTYRIAVSIDDFATHPSPSSRTCPLRS